MMMLVLMIHITIFSHSRQRRLPRIGVERLGLLDIFIRPVPGDKRCQTFPKYFTLEYLDAPSRVFFLPWRNNAIALDAFVTRRQPVGYN